MRKNIKNIKMQKDSKNIYTRFTWYGFILIRIWYNWGGYIMSIKDIIKDLIKESEFIKIYKEYEFDVDSIYSHNFKSNVHIDLKNALRRLSNDEKIIIDILTFKDGVEALDNYKDYFSLYSNVTDYEKHAIVLYYLNKHFGLN